MDKTTQSLIVESLRGVLDLHRTAAGLTPSRLPSWTRQHHDSELMELVAGQTSGVRLVLQTTGSWIELTSRSTRVLYPNQDPADIPVPYAATIDGESREAVLDWVGSYRVVPFDGPGSLKEGRPRRIRFELGPSRGTGRLVEIWLPNNASVELLDLNGDGDIRPAPPSGRPKWVHHGSSISHCSEASSPLAVWPVAAAQQAELDVTALGFGGNAQLDPFVARTIGAQHADMISLKLGINIVNGDTMKRRTFIPAVHGFLDSIRDKKPDVPILLISPISCPMHETEPGPLYFDPQAGRLMPVPPSRPGETFGALNLGDVRDILQDIVHTRRADDPALRYLDGRHLFGPQDVHDLSDGLHPNTDGYRRMAKRFVNSPEVAAWRSDASQPAS
ncbi:GDSL-type esterase/lipase family protein [Arthrobacter sp. 2MCAF15]|uniref:GDSL-type esterase/lipase family protein n=1 Tax=Arthrobacter sp. 2MCAF15 TaxID=3232984 RepID=UPI003F902D1B